MSAVDEKINSFWNPDLERKYENAMYFLIKRINEIDKEYYQKTGNHIIRFIEKRLKTSESIANKLKRKGKESECENIENAINDLAGVRAICFDTKQVYKLVDAIRETKEFEVIKEKDYIAKPKNNGYQSYHMILGFLGTKVELQIRTILMDAWSSLETILIYKKTNPTPKDLEDDIQKFSRWSRKMDSLVEKLLERKE